MSVLLLLSTVNFKDIIKIADMNITDNENYKFVSILNSLDLDYGYATFWHSQSISVLSNGKIRCANVNAGENGIEPYYYQNEKQWFGANSSKSGKYFLLLSEGEIDSLNLSTKENLFSSALDSYTLDGYKILVFSNNGFIF